MIVRLPSPVDAPTVAEALDAALQAYASEPAIVTASRTWTYDDLAGAVHAVACGLIRAGVPTAGDPVVAVVLDRSAEFVATVLGVLAAGATYLPLDPQAPDSYVQQVLEEARPVLVVTSAGRAERIRTGTQARVCAYPDLLNGPAVEVSGVPSAAAYIIYTSGSTGTPKGVVVPHTALLNSTAARTDVYGRAGRVPLLHSPAFDLTTGVLFWTLLTGGTLIIESMPLADVAGTVDLINRHQATHLIYPASLYSAFLDRIAAQPPASLTAVGIGSERWSPALIDRHAAVMPGVSLVNEYGPTEACVCSSYSVVYDSDTGHRAPMSIGTPVRNTGYLILDADGQPARSGELVIIGANLATGYLNRDQLTEQRFITVDGKRGYRTGDLVEQAPDGTFVFLGRADRQIQIGGHRVEPGHVETVLMGHPAIMQAHVAPRPASDGGDAAALIAYLVPIPGLHRAGADDDPAFIDDCDRFLRGRLPSYLVPATYVVLEELPRTAAGKIDDRRLPDPAGTVHDPADADDGGDVLLRSLAARAATILGVPRLAPSASLTQLGVNSLALIRLAAAITADHGVDVPISALFAARTITDVAGLVRKATPAARTIEPGTSEPRGSYPLSGQQAQIWVLTQLAPDARAYNTQFSLHLHGPVDVDALQAALTSIVARHEILRTTFHDSATGPVQVVHPPWPAIIDLVDLSGLERTDRDAALASRMQAAVGVGFDIAALPLVRWHLFRLAHDQWRLLQAEHHFAHDGWSAQLLLAELRDAYTAIVEGRDPDLPTLAVQYRDYASWYQRWRTTTDFTAYTDYWRKQLDDCPADGATFTPDRPRPAVRSFRGDRIDTHIPAVVVQRVDELAARHGVSRFAVFLSAFAVQVWQHTARSDIVVGSALANRRLPGTAALLGMFVNALPLRVHVDPDAGVADLLHATMTMLLGAQDHQELPLLDLLAHLDRPRDPGHNPLFNVMFAFHDTPRPLMQMGPVQAQLVIEHNATAKGDVNVVCVPDPDHDGTGGMTVLWEYDTDLFDRATVDRLLSGFATILGRLPDSSDRAVRHLDLLGADETCRILTASRGLQEPLPHDTLHAGFAAAAAAQPDAVAVVHRGARWTYRDLDERAAVLQARLAAVGVRAGGVVAVACPPGIDLITAILAVLRSAALYVCLDPDQPAARTGEILTDAGARIIITTGHTVLDPDAVGARTVVTADDLPPLDASATPAPQPVEPGDGAYLVYTSGSTGTPKAVVTTHGNACTAIHARTRFLHDAGTGAGPVTTLITLPAIFDVGPHMMMWTFWSGGTVVFPDSPDQIRDPSALRVLIETAGITHVNFTASFYRQWLTAVPAGWQPRLQVVAVGGEPCTPQDVRTHAELLPAVALDHEYGPTEGTVWCTAQRLHPASPNRMSRVTVGGPLVNYTVAVLDPASNLAPAGATGELVIGGPGVAAGYHRRPDLTGQRFVTPAAGPFVGQRLYLTGDRARLTDTGFEILGRTDDQVKIRGFRVELGEITTQLRAHPDVTDAAVLVHGDGDAARLIAYAATPGSHTGFGERLRAWLVQRLPAYMIPAVFMVADQLPRTSTGKIDAKELAALPAAGGPEPGHGPSTDQQWLLAQVWRDVLQQPALGIDDDFFAAGGDSLQAIQAAARITALGVTVSVAELLAAPTVRALDILLTNRPASAGIAVTDRRPVGTTLATTPIQEWFINLGLVDPDHFHQSRLLRIPAHSDLARLRAALSWTAGRHDAFRTRFTRTGKTWTVVLADQVPADLIREHTLPPDTGTPVAEQLEVALRGLHEQIRIADGRLASFTIMHDPTGASWLYLIAHHLIVDVVSWQMLLADIEHAYQLLTDGRPLPHGCALGLPSLDSTATVQPAPDLRRWEALAAAATPRLGTGRRGTATLADRVQLTRQLSARAGTYLRLEVPRLHGITAHAVLLAALKRAITPASTGIGLYVWLEGHGRGVAGTRGADHAVGWLTSLHPALFTVDDGLPARLVDVATSIHRQTSAAADAAAGLGDAVLRNPGSALYQQLAAAGLPQITFNYLGQPADSTDRLLQPVAAPEGATIGASNVLPTPFDLTVAPASDGTVTCRFSVDPTVLDPAQAAQVADRFTAELEAAARLIPLTGAAVGPARRTLFLIHPVGGLLDWYLPLVNGLGPGWECYGIPRDRACADTTMQDLASRYLALIRAAQPDGRYVVGGWCLGGPLAYEIARQAHADGDGDRIDEVILLDPPRAERPRNPHAVLISHIHNACPHQSRTAVVDALATTGQLPVEQRAAALVDLLGPVVPGRADPQLLSQLVMRLTDHAAMSAWQPTATVGRMTLYVPQTGTPDHDDAVATWQPYSRELTAVTIPGDHESLLVTAELIGYLDAPSRPGSDDS
ncbi:non-ribosomal peptide synthetase [Actinoplanes sp. DH11]|uniref:non-ribosomal peptide synthetase n=1 Tax=Actinoplanes sp. DH11 TaxID=2857011 RepID=UPI001E38DB8D|nr:non-ribosomal peptide synthetase [Actinoplanes sp. DH11]